MGQGFRHLKQYFVTQSKKSIIITLSIVLFLSLIIYKPLHTQNDSSIRNIYNQAEIYEVQDDYASALPLYKELVERDPANPNFNFKYGLCLVESNSHISALPYLKRASEKINSKYRSSYRQNTTPPLTLYYLAKEYHAEYYFVEALKTYQEYEKYLTYVDVKKKEKITTLKEYCKSGIQLIKNPQNVKHLDFSEATTVSGFAHSPIFSPDGSVYIFTSNKEIGVPLKNNFSDNIYYTYFSNGKWNEPKLFSENILSTNNEASLGVHPNGKQLLIYRNDNGVGNLYYSDLEEDNTWSKPKKFPRPINSSYNESHISISADGNIVYFTSDRPGGFGGLDIYFCQKDKDGKWSDAINLGPKINTKYHEEGPHLQGNGSVLYFSSDRLSSMGGFDIFSCRVDGNMVIGVVKNLGYPINTPANDLFFKTTHDGSTGYYSTSCRASRGDLDLSIVHFLDVPRKPNVRVKGLVLNEWNDTLYNLKVNLFDIARRDIIDSTQNKIDNRYYEFDLFSERKYFASFEYKGYVYFSKPFEIEKYFACLSFSNVIELEPIVLTDSTFRQSISDFIITKRMLKENEDKNINDIVDRINEEETTSLSVNNTSLPTTIDPSRLIPPVDTVKYDILDVADIYPRGLSIIQNEISLLGDAPIDDHRAKRAIADSIKREGIRFHDNEKYLDAIQNFLDAIDIYRELSDVEEQIDCIRRIASIYSEIGNPHLAIKIYEDALALGGNSNSKQTGDNLYAIGSLYYDLYNSANALNYLNRSLDVRKEIDDKNGELESVTKIGDVHFQHRRYNRAIHYYDMAITLSDELNMEENKASLHNKIGLSNQAMNKLEEAISQYSIALEISQKFNNKKSQSIYLNNIANVKYEQQKYEEAIIFYEQSVAIKKEIQYMDGLAISLYNLGNSYRKIENNDEAIKYFLESLEISEKENLLELQAYNHFGLSQSYAANSVFDKALFHYKKYIEYRSPYLYVDMKLQAFQNISKYEINQKDLSQLRRKIQEQELFSRLESDRRKAEINLLQEFTKRQEFILWMTIILSLAGFGLLIFLLFAIRNKRKIHNQLSLKNAKISQANEKINAQKDSLEDINIELEKLSIVASKTSNGVAIIDEKFKFEWVNNSFVDFYNFVDNTNINVGDSIYCLSKNNEIKQIIDNCIENKIGVNFEHYEDNSEKERIWFQTSLTPIVFDGDIYKIILIESDITSIKTAEIEIRKQKDHIEIQRDEIGKQRDIAIAQKEEIEEQKDQLEDAIEELHRTQKKLVESEKMASLGNLVAGVAHEINTPVGIGIAASSALITKTKSITQLFEEKKMKQSDLLNYLSTSKDAAKLIQTNLQRTGDLVKSFKRVSVDEVTEQMREFNVAQYFKEVVVSLEPKIKERRANIKIDCPENIVIKSYPGVFAQIITNFVVNSITHAYKDKYDGNISILISENKNILKIVYSDDGSGMSKHVIENVFNPFFTTNMQTGTGLGMNIVYNIITQKLKGEIICESTLGKGTTFIIEIPKEIQ